MQLAFWILFAIVAWCYAGYPLTMLVRAALWPRASARDASTAELPLVSVVVAVRNEALHIRERLPNLLSQNYPADRLEVIVCGNGCSDDTETIAAEVAAEDPRVRVLTSPGQEGKTGALNRGVEQARGSVVVFADGRQRFHADAVHHLVTALADPGVGAVSGRTVITRSDTPALEGVGWYWGMETRLRMAESLTGSTVQAQGAIYAIRRELFEPFPPNLILDDVYLPLRIAMRGYRLSLTPDALSFDVPADDQRREFQRKLRTMTGNLQLVRVLPAALSPWRNPIFFRFVSHKLLRVLSPPLLLGMLVLALTSSHPLYQTFGLAQLTFYLLGAIGLVARIRPLSIPAAFVLVHLAVLIALLRPGRDASDVWARTLTTPNASRAS